VDEKMKQRGKKAVSPVLATLMMVAVAVALSVIIFTWSQGFLSQTGEAASGQQAAQNIAAQSGILIQAVSTQPWKDGGDSYQNGTIVISIRNVGTVSTTLSTIYITPPAAGNTGLNQTLIVKWNPDTTTWDVSGTATDTVGFIKASGSPAGTPTISPRSSYMLTIEFGAKNAQLAGKGYRLQTGDVFTVKATTTVGTFTQGTYTVA